MQNVAKAVSPSTLGPHGAARATWSS